jgi:OmpA-OmpF porin, OOP family
MLILRVAALAAAPILLAACAGTGIGLQKAERMRPQGSEFERQLYANYIDLSRSEFDEGDYRDSDHFAARAVAAASGRPTEPEPIEKRNLPKDHVAELAEARAGLMTALANGAREADPFKAARAQAMFDCWMQEQEENFQPDDIAACRGAFEAAMADIKVRPEPVAVVEPEPEPEPVIPESEVAQELVTRGEARVYGINFDFNRETLRADATPVLQDILAVLRAKPGMNLRIEGHTDALGEDAYNADLSQRRAQSVVNWLVDNGIAAERLEAKGMGEAQPIADNGTNEGRAENRRVELKTRTN